MKQLLIILFLFNITNAKTLDKVTLQLQWKHQFESAGFYMAKEKGFYKDVGLDVDFIEFNSNINIIDKVTTTPNMYGISYSNIISEYLKGKPIVFVANFFKQSPLAIVAHKDIKLPSDLIGKKVMGSGNDINSEVISMMFKKFGMSSTDFTSVEPTFRIDEFVEKKVDAMTVYTTNEIFALNKQGVAYNLLNPTVYGAEFYDINLFTSKNELKLHPQRVSKFKEASIKGWKYALSHKQEAIDIVFKKYNSLNKSIEALQYEAKQIENIMLANIYSIGSIDINRVKLMIDDFKGLGLVPYDVDANLEDFIFEEYHFDIKLTKENIINYSIVLILMLILFGIIWNIKLNQKVQKEILKNKEQESLIHHYSKQESMKNMLGNISHQWRHPLSELSSTIMLLDTKLALNQNISKEDIESMTKDSKNIIEFMSKTIDTFNNFYKKTSDDDNKSFFIDDAICETLFILKGSFELNNITVEIKSDKNIQVIGNINQLEQVILSVLVNAQDTFIKRDIKYRQIQINSYKLDEKIIIEISDNANGIKVKNIDKIFNLSISDNNSTGLGLFISKNIIETKFNGKIKASNRKNGAMFTIILS